MERRQASDFPRGRLDHFREYQLGHVDRRSFLNGAGRFAVGALTVGATFEMLRPNYAGAQQVAKVIHPASARVLERLRTRFTFQISVDVATVERALRRRFHRRCLGRLRGSLKTRRRAAALSRAAVPAGHQDMGTTQRYMHLLLAAVEHAQHQNGAAIVAIPASQLPSV